MGNAFDQQKSVVCTDAHRRNNPQRSDGDLLAEIRKRPVRPVQQKTSRLQLSASRFPVFNTWTAAHTLSNLETNVIKFAFEHASKLRNSTKDLRTKEFLFSR
jgi:hypothetical protein